MKRLPCLYCEAACEAKEWLTRAMELSKAGIEVISINLPCPKDGVVYQVDLSK